MVTLSQLEPTTIGKNVESTPKVEQADKKTEQPTKMVEQQSKPVESSYDSQVEESTGDVFDDYCENVKENYEKEFDEELKEPPKIEDSEEFEEYENFECKWAISAKTQVDTDSGKFYK